MTFQYGSFSPKCFGIFVVVVNKIRFGYFKTKKSKALVAGLVASLIIVVIPACLGHPHCLRLRHGANREGCSLCPRR